MNVEAAIRGLGSSPTRLLRLFSPERFCEGSTFLAIVFQNGFFMSPAVNDSSGSKSKSNKTDHSAAESHPSPRSVEALIDWIRHDSVDNSTLYLLRSNTTHDGE